MGKYYTIYLRVKAEKLNLKFRWKHWWWRDLAFWLLSKSPTFDCGCMTIEKRIVYRDSSPKLEEVKQGE